MTLTPGDLEWLGEVVEGGEYGARISTREQASASRRLGDIGLLIWEFKTGRNWSAWTWATPAGVNAIRDGMTVEEMNVERQRRRDQETEALAAAARRAARARLGEGQGTASGGGAQDQDGDQERGDPLGELEGGGTPGGDGSGEGPLA